MLTAIPRRPICASFTSALSLNANSSTLLTVTAVPRATQGNALGFQSNAIEYLSTGNQYGINQVKEAGLAQSGDFPFVQLPEFILIKTVEPLDLQRCSVIQHDVEHDGSKQIQRQRGRNELLSRRSACDQFSQD